MADNSRYSVVDTQEDIESNNSITFGEPSYTCCCRKKQYGFQIVNWIAIAVHFLSFLAMIVIYAGEEPVTYPYTETFIQWKRLNTTVDNDPDIIDPHFFKDLGGTDMPYAQNYNDWNHCIKNISKTNCEDIEYLKKIENDDYWVVQPSSAISTMPHGCLNVNYMDVNEGADELNKREVQWNENSDSVKCNNDDNKPKTRRLAHQRHEGEGNCLCTTSDIWDLPTSLQKTQTGSVDVRITREVCRSYAFLQDKDWFLEILPPLLHRSCQRVEH